MSDPTLGEGTGLPGYQPPGYGVAPSRPAMPDRIKLAVNLMLAGAVIKAVEGIVLVSGSTGRFGGDAMVGAFITVGMWIWMSFAIRGGANWGRITGTVFFGFATLGVLIDLLVLASPRGNVHGVSAAAVGFDFVNWGVGLAVTILIWQKANAPFFRPQPYGTQPYSGVQGPDWPPAPLQ
jgi:hypothetical protein